MKDRFHIKKFYPNYLSFIVSGSVALVLGAVLPYLIDEAGVSLTAAGSLLSFFAIGNFAASFAYPPVSKLLGRKWAFVALSIFQPVSLVCITFLPHVGVLLAAFFMLGLTRGSSSIFNNAYVNEHGDGSAASLNILHMIFAVGAFSAPFMLSLFVKNGLGWRFELYILAVVACVVIFLLSRLDMSQPAELEKDASGNSTAGSRTPPVSTGGGKRFWASPLFWVTGLLLFFYLGYENCVNGWFVTYFKSSGLMSPFLANNLVSFTWGAVLVGRFTTAVLSARFSKKVLILADCIAVAVCFFLMTSSSNLAVIGISIIVMGFFLAGIYPTCVSAAGPAVNGSDLAMSMLLAVAAFGGIITPQIVGIIADHSGFAGAMGLLIVNLVIMTALAVIHCLFRTQKKSVL